MPNNWVKNRTGLRYGRLTAIKLEGKNTKGRYTWFCECDCGNTKSISSDNLASGKSKSCGCLKKDHLVSSGRLWKLHDNREDAILSVQYSHLKRRHQKKKYGGTVISFDTFKKLSLSNCNYCGLEYSKEIEDRLSESNQNKLLSETVVKCNGIDRIDNLKGYTVKNSCTCCKFCNTAKSTMSVKEFQVFIKRIYNHMME